MNQDLSAPALTQLARRYYPASIGMDDPRHDESEEARRRSARLEAAMKDTGGWERFLRRVEEAFPGCTVRDASSLPYESSHRCNVTLSETRLQNGKEENAVGCMLSLLAPVYAVYATHRREEGLNMESWRRFPPLPPEFQAHEAKLAALVESSFGFSRLPNDVLFTPVPELRIGMLGNRGARLLECLF
jgi:hypothetical protein